MKSMKANISRRAFSLIELLVVITIIVMLVSIMGVAMNSARASGKKQTTKSAIAAIDTILQRHFSSCESTPLTLTGNATADAEELADIGLKIRKKITADMPDSWEEVKYMVDNPSLFPGARQRSYIANYNALKAVNPSRPSSTHGSAECLFMIVMQGGLADCLACTSLNGVRKGDKDSDGALEFWDTWDQPIRYVLWPAGFELPLGEKYFAQVKPFSGLPVPVSTGGLMRPLVFSGGPSKFSSTAENAGSYLALGVACGDPADATIATLGGHDGGGDDYRSDNLTNYDDTVKK